MNDTCGSMPVFEFRVHGFESLLGQKFVWLVLGSVPTLVAILSWALIDLVSTKLWGTG